MREAHPALPDFPCCALRIRKALKRRFKAGTNQNALMRIFPMQLLLPGPAGAAQSAQQECVSHDPYFPENILSSLCFGGYNTRLDEYTMFPLSKQCENGKGKPYFFLFSFLRQISLDLCPGGDGDNCALTLYADAAGHVAVVHSRADNLSRQVSCLFNALNAQA